MSTQPRTFDLVRTVDPSGISGVGIIAQGTEFRDGQTVLQWCVPGKPREIQIWDSLDDMLLIHGHEGSTLVRWHCAIT